MGDQPPQPIAMRSLMVVVVVVLALELKNAFTLLADGAIFCDRHDVCSP